MNRFAIPLLVFAALVVLFFIALNRPPESRLVPSALINRPAPEFTLPDLLKPGETVSSSSFKGRWHLINVWGTWCRECYIEHPLLLEIAREGMTLVGLNYKDEDEAARQWLADYGNPFAAVPVDKQGDTAIDYGVYGAPETFLVNPEGIIVHKVVGVITRESWEKTLQPLMKGAKP